MINKKGFINLPAILIILLVILIIYFGFFNTGSLTQSCEYGHWGIASYDMQKGEIIVTGNVNSMSWSGCLDAYTVRNPEGSALGLYNKEDCEYIYGTGSWRADLGKCQLVNEDWIKGKTITYYGSCTMVCSDPRGCGLSFPYGVATTTKYDAGFDGTTFSFPETGQAWLKKTCTGGAVVHFTPRSSLPSGTPTTPEDSTPPTTTTPDCYANVDCVATCGSKTPTCINDKCYCDNIVTTAVHKESIFDKINKFIQSIIDGIMGIFK